MQSFICTTCGTGYPPSDAPPAHCPVCEDERQYVNANGQAWTTLEALRREHRTDWRELEPGLFGIGATPTIAIGQRALFVPQPGGGVIWDLTPLVNDEVLERIERLGGVRAIAISHPHFHTTLADWSRALGDVPIYIHADNRPFTENIVPAIDFWSGETKELGQGVTLVRTGGHFEGSAILHWADGADGKGVLMTGDTIMVVPDTRHMSFMRSYPNLIPLPARTVERILAATEPFAFDRIYAAWWDRVSSHDAKARLRRSADRYIAALK